MIERVPPKALVPYLNERTLYQFQWGYRKQGRRLEEFLGWAKKELRPVLADLVAQAEQEAVFDAAGGLRLLEGRGRGQRPRPLRPRTAASELARFTLPRQPKEDGECIADFLRDIGTTASAT